MISGVSSNLGNNTSGAACYIQHCASLHHLVFGPLSQRHDYICLQCCHVHCCSAGSLVKAGQKLAVLSAMKMETAVQAPCDGLLRHVGVSKGDSLDAGMLFPVLCLNWEYHVYAQKIRIRTLHSCFNIYLKVMHTQTKVQLV